MRSPADSNSPGEIGRRLSRLIVGRGTRRGRPESIEADAKLHAAHVRPAPFRPGLY